LAGDLITRFGRDGEKRLASILDDRVHKIAWTSASELLEELKRVLGDGPKSVVILTPQTEAALKRVSEAIDSLLGSC
jgi:hypothetical protein